MERKDDICFARRSLLSAREAFRVSPERLPRCAGTVMPLRRNAYAVAPEPPPRCAGTAEPCRWELPYYKEKGKRSLWTGKTMGRRGARATSSILRLAVFLELAIGRKEAHGEPKIWYNIVVNDRRLRATGFGRRAQVRAFWACCPRASLFAGAVAS